MCDLARKQRKVSDEWKKSNIIPCIKVLMSVVIVER